MRRAPTAKSGRASTLLGRNAGANRVSAGWVDGRVSLLDVLDDAVAIHHKGGPSGQAVILVQDAVILGDLVGHIAEQGKVHADFIGEFLVGYETVDTDAQNLSSGGFEFGDISLIRLEFLRSTTGKSEHVKSQHHVLALEVAQLDLLAILVAHGEVRGLVAHLQMCGWRGGWRWLLGRGREHEQRRQQAGSEDSHTVPSKETF